MILVRHAPLIALALTGSVGLAACGGSSLDSDEIETAVVTKFRDQGVVLRETSCEDVDAEVGAPVRCTALNPKDTTLVIEGKVTGLDGDRARFHVVATRGEAKGTAVAADARKLLEAEVGQRAKGMTCPEKVAIPTAKPARCTLTVGSGVRYGVSVTIDDKGSVKAIVDRQRMS